ncbi:MAG: FG-GAP-like repeat-containing protein, partial [Candidatus Latescibacterota bacterium]
VIRDVANVLFENDGVGNFTAVTGEANDAGDGNDGAWGDYDNDGYLDIYVGNASTNVLYHNNGDGTFTELASGAGVANGNQAYGVTWGDYDNDGYLDLYLSNWSPSNNLYKNNGAGGFVDVTTATGTAAVGLNGQGAGWADFDHDGDLDLYMAGDTGNVLYVNDGANTFHNLSVVGGVGSKANGRGISWGDYDDDGDLDLYVTHYNSPNALYRNDSNPNNNWLHVTLEESVSAPDGIGAHVIARTGTLRQVRQVESGSGYQTYSLDVEFGFGAASTVDSLMVKWPSGNTSLLLNVALPDTITIQEVEPVVEATVASTFLGIRHALPDEEIQVFTIGVTGDGTDTVSDITLIVDDVASSGFNPSNDVYQFSVYESSDGVLDFNDSLLGSELGTNVTAGTPFTITVTGGSAIGSTEVFYIVAADLATGATTGHGFKTSFVNDGFTTTNSNAVGTGFSTPDGDRVEIAPIGTMTTVAGNGTQGYQGDGGAGFNAQMNHPIAIVADDDGNVYVAEEGSHVIRKIDASGKVSTVAGTGSSGSAMSDGDAATTIQL